MRRNAAAATVVAAAVAWVMWSGCGTSGSGHPGGTGGYQQGTPTKKPEPDAAPDTASADRASSDGPTADGLPYPGAEACLGWSGWYRAPGLPKGCFSGCVPDDPTLRIPALKWDARNDWCPGCKWLETPWWPDPEPQDRPALELVQGFGPGPDYLFLVTRQQGQGNVVAIYDHQGRAAVGLWAGHDISCGVAQLNFGQHDGTVGMTYRDAGLTHQRWLLRPADRARELLTATEPDFAYTDAFVGNDSSEGSWLTADWIVDEFTGFLALANVKTGTATKIDTMPGALPGEYDRAVISGNAVFVMHFTNKADWMVVENGVVKSFLGGPNIDIDKFTTDGKWIVWNEGSQLSYDPGNPTRLVSGRYDLYRSPFTTDPSKLQRQLLVPDTHQFYGYSTLANGYFTGVFVTNPGQLPVHSEALVVEAATGKAWTSDLPQGYSWGEQNYPTPTELWGSIAPTGNDEYASAVVRVPYSDMTQIQTGFP